MTTNGAQGSSVTGTPVNTHFTSRGCSGAAAVASWPTSGDAGAASVVGCTGAVACAAALGFSLRPRVGFSPSPLPLPLRPSPFPLPFLAPFPVASPLRRSSAPGVVGAAASLPPRAGRVRVRPPSAGISELALLGDPLGLDLGCLFVVATSLARSAAGPRSILSHTLSYAALGAGTGVGGGGASRSGLGAVRPCAAPAPALSCVGRASGSAGFSSGVVTAARTGPTVAGGSWEGFSSSGHICGPYSTGAASGRSGPIGRDSCCGLSGVCSGLGGAGFSPKGGCTSSAVA
mmetsp:Transcript_7513/g.16880  ORF Transcript_7513/g.16880 Transcript_7513/m.16880 type:complete len:289 (-) Transcript_7513:609-1475(-)